MRGPYTNVDRIVPAERWIRSSGYRHRPNVTAESRVIATSSSSPRVVYGDVHCIAGTFQNLAIVVWDNDTQTEAMRMVADMLWRLASQFPAGIGLLQVVGERHPPLRGQTRSELNRMLRAAAGYLRCSTLVFEGQGFRAAAMRGLAAGLVMLARWPFPHQVCRTLQAALDLQMAHLPPGLPDLDRAAFSRAVDILRARFRRPPAEQRTT
jgi:hypothetical protein